MYLRFFLAFTFAAIVTAASIPLVASIIQLPSQNLTILSPSRNATTTLGGSWPNPPFRRHLEWDTDIEVISRAPTSPSDPTPESSILGDIRLIGTKVRSEGTRLAMMHDYYGQSGSVEFGFHGLDHLFRASEIAMVLEVIADMTNLYGSARIYGTLVKEGTYIAEFEIGLKIPTWAK